MINKAFSLILTLEPIKKTSLMTRYNFYSLLTAITHAQNGLEVFQGYHDFGHQDPLSSTDQVLVNLTALADALDAKESFSSYDEFVKASSAATNRVNQRVVRFRWICKALLPKPL